ncbi:MAG: methyltransferase domain-containing protein [Deltaproteobacteria bacterium]|nr:MAG: methyltransferase domain-containing protein [Deltaproteobacteria bacterium]
MSPLCEGDEERQGEGRMRDAIPAGPRVNLGCGPVQPEGWVNIDGSRRAWLAARLPWLDRLLTRLGLLEPTEFGPGVTVHDLRKPLPFPSGAVAAIYAGEVWEHFEYPDAVRLTRECFRVLAPGGVLRVCVPDGVAFWRKYLELYDREIARPRDERSAKALRDHVALYFRDICTRRRILGSMGHTHKWQFDEVQLLELFECVGFVMVERMPFHRSRIPHIEAVERSDFLIVEGVKPLR